MLKLVIVDDERLVRELISLCVDWNELGYEIVGSAKTAEEGLELVEKIQPDVLFTDVRMPGKTGLDLGRTVLEEFPDLKVVVISGYDEFSYVNEGLKMGIFDYILKPIDAEVLKEIAIKLRGVIEEERKHKEEFRQYKEILERNYASIREKSIGRLVTSKNVESVAENLRFFGIELEENCFQAAIIEYKQEEEFEQEQDLLKSIQVRKSVDDYFKKYPNVLIFESRFQRVDLINNQNGLNFYHELLRFAEEFGKKHSISIRIGVGERYSDIRQLSISYREARHVLHHILSTEKNACHIYSEIVKINAAETYIEESYWKNLGHYLRQGMVNEAKKEVTKGFNGFQTRALQKEEIIFASMNYAMEIFAAAAEIRIEQAAVDKYRKEVLSKLVECREISELHYYLIGLIDSIFYLYRRENETKNINVIQNVEKYVKENYESPDLTLAQVAELMFVNPNYLSRAFKKRTGKTFREYLFDLRMEEAFRLLRQTSMKSYEVAEKVGIKDPGYFSTCFKKKYGISVLEMERR